MIISNLLRSSNITQQRKQQKKQQKKRKKSKQKYLRVKYQMLKTEKEKFNVTRHQKKKKKVKIQQNYNLNIKYIQNLTYRETNRKKENGK